MRYLRKRAKNSMLLGATKPGITATSRVASFDAGLGRKEDAIGEALRAVDLMPIAKDSVRGPWLVRNLAMVYAWTGERDLAIEQLEIVAKIPGGPTYGELRFDPTWDSLQGRSTLREARCFARAETSCSPGALTRAT